MTNISQVDKKEFIGYVYDVHPEYIVVEIMSEGGELLEIPRLDFHQGEYERTSDKVYKLVTERRCRYCNQRPIYDNDQNEYFCPVCEGKW